MEGLAIIGFIKDALATVNDVRFMISEDLALGPGPGFIARDSRVGVAEFY